MAATNRPREPTWPVKSDKFNFQDPIQFYDIHVYFNDNYTPSRNESRKLREKLYEDFPEEIEDGRILVKAWDKKLGPHFTEFWEFDFGSTELFAKLVPWITLNHGNLSVLIHPHTGEGQDYKDHTNHALWLGQPVPLSLELLLPGGSDPNQKRPTQEDYDRVINNKQ